MVDKNDAEMHPVVQLMLARMESHPEEFGKSADRWFNVIAQIERAGNDRERAVIAAAMRVINLDDAHKDAMDELCNGEERKLKLLKQWDENPHKQTEQNK